MSLGNRFHRNHACPELGLEVGPDLVLPIHEDEARSVLPTCGEVAAEPPEGLTRSFQVSDVADETGHTSVAMDSDGADARVVGEDAQPPGLELHDVRQAGDDRSAVAHHDHPPALMVAHDVVDASPHPGRRRPRSPLALPYAALPTAQPHPD